MIGSQFVKCDGGDPIRKTSARSSAPSYLILNSVLLQGFTSFFPLRCDLHSTPFLKDRSYTGNKVANKSSKAIAYIHGVFRHPAKSALNSLSVLSPHINTDVSMLRLIIDHSAVVEFERKQQCVFNRRLWGIGRTQCQNYSTHRALAKTKLQIALAKLLFHSEVLSSVPVRGLCFTVGAPSPWVVAPLTS